MLKWLLITLCVSYAIAREGSSGTLWQKSRIIEALQLSPKQQLVYDIIKTKSGENLILVTGNEEKDLASILTRHQQSLGDVISTTNIQISSITKEFVSDLRKMQNTTGNFPNFYLISLTDEQNEENLERVVKTIRTTDYDAKIAIIGSSVLDVLEFYKGTDPYDVYLFKPHKKDTVFEMFRSCRYCNQGADVVKMVNIWKEGFGFKLPLEFVRSFTGNFYGTTIRMASIFWRPNIFIVGKDENGEDILDGVYYHAYVVLGEMLNLNWKFVRPSKGSPWEFGNYGNDLLDGKVEVAGGGWIGSWDLNRVVEFTATTRYLPGYSIASAEPLKGMRWTAIVEPFDKYTWGFLLLSLPICGVALYYFRKFSRRPDKPARIGDAFWDISVILCWDSITSKNPSMSIIIHLFAYMFVSLTVVTAYMGVYTSQVISQKYVRPPIDTLDQLWNSDFKWASCHASSTKYFTRVFKDIVPDIENRLLDCSNEDATEHPTVRQMKKIMESPDKVVAFGHGGAMIYQAIKNQLETNGRKFHYSKEKWDVNSVTLFISKTSYFKEAINRKINLMQAMHLAWAIDQAAFNEELVKQGVKIGKIKEKVPLIQLKHFTGAWVLMGVGYVAALISLLVEIVIKWKKERKIKKEKIRAQREMENNDGKIETDKGIMKADNGKMKIEKRGFWSNQLRKLQKPKHAIIQVAPITEK